MINLIHKSYIRRALKIAQAKVKQAQTQQQQADVSVPFCTQGTFNSHTNLSLSVSL